MMEENDLELLCPAGTIEKLKIALHYGADAVYFSGKNFGLRAFAGNFSDEEIVEATKLCHHKNKKAYVTLNILARDDDFQKLQPYLDLLVKAKVDAVIVSDLGLIEYISKHAPSLDIHVSTQANVTNSHTANHLAQMGVKRIVLARELKLEQIKNIIKNIPKHVEIECFVHGAMCISYSGRCLLSNYMDGRDSNRGECVQACRWQYKIREVSRDGEEYEIEEDERGSYILNSKDLCMINHLKELKAAGVASLKIEGRMKSQYYVATTTNAYRRAIDNLDRIDDNFNYVEELEKTGHRKFTTGLYFDGEKSIETHSSLPVQNSVFVANVVDDASNGYVCVQMRNRFKTGDTLEILSPSDLLNKKLVVEEILDSLGNKIEDVKAVQQIVYLKTNYPLKKLDILRRSN